MMLNPRNRHLLVVPQDEQEQEEERAVLLPENYRTPQSPYAVVSVLVNCSRRLTAANGWRYPGSGTFYAKRGDF